MRGPPPVVIESQLVGRFEQIVISQWRKQCLSPERTNPNLEQTRATTADPSARRHYSKPERCSSHTMTLRLKYTVLSIRLGAQAAASSADTLSCRMESRV